MLLPTHRIADRCIVVFPEIVDIANAPALRSGLRRVISDHSCPGGLFIVDLSQSRFVTATTLSVLVGLRRRLLAQRTRLSVAGDAPLVRNAFSATGLRRIIPLYATVAEARAEGSALVARSHGGAKPAGVPQPPVAV